MKNITFGAAYMTSPFFCHDIDDIGPIEIDDVPISSKLREDIRNWDFEYQHTLNEDYPPDSKFPTPDLQILHNTRGFELAFLIQKELGNNFLINFYPVT